MKFVPHLLTSLAAVALCLAPAARADVITYKDGKVIRGLIQANTADPNNVRVLTDSGTLRIPRERVAQVQEESPAQGWVHIGNGYRAKNRLNDAVQAYQKALDAEPGNAAAQQAIDAAQAAVQQEQHATRQQALQEIDQFTAQSDELIRGGKFEEALAVLEQANARVPSEEQKAKLRHQISQLYLEWSKEREDKLDRGGAEEKLKLALAADAQNKEVIDRMLVLWKDNPQRRGDVANVYETMLEGNPGDDALRKELGDLYYDMQRWEDATNHYLKLYQRSDAFKGSQLEARLIEMLTRLHGQYARTKDYDRAIQYYQMLSAIDPDTDPTAVVQYQYLQASAATREDDVAGQLKLALFAEQNGMEQQALERYRRYSQIPEAREQSLAGLERYAQRAFNDAEFQFKQGNYELSAALAAQIKLDFPTASVVSQKVPELIGRAQVEGERNKRQARERARDVLTRADEFYQQASFYFNNLFSTERVNNPYLSSSREEAKRYYRYAIQAYEDALRIDPSLGKESNSLVMVRLNECKSRLRKLSTGVAAPSRFGTPMNTPQSSIPSMSR